MNASAFAPSQSHTVTLPAALDLDVAATLSRTLNNCRGEDVVIDASYVQKLGAQCFQVLHAAQQTWKADNRLFTLINGPARLVEELSGYGVELAFA
jgi:chemotaxis protein CheX